MNAKTQPAHRRVQAHYAPLAQGGSACCDPNYNPDELAVVPPESVLGLGSGSPVRAADLKEGEVVVDLGSGAGVDVFLAAHLVGARGQAIGIDMTPAMVERARNIARCEGVPNVTFHESVIEEVPLESGSADVVLSNCVINLSPDKAAVFREAYRVLRPGGRLVISDIVQERPLEIPDPDCGCIATAMVRAQYFETIRAAGFSIPEILADKEWLVGAEGVDASSVTVRAFKPAAVA